MHFIAVFITISILVMFLGSKQQKSLDKYSIASVLLFILLAAVGIALLHGTIFFAAHAFATALLLCVHHMISNFHAEDSLERCSLFKGKTVLQHETWIVAAVVAGAVSMLKL